MSTKDLSRTVIEGGRVRYNQYCRRRSHRIERAAWRRFEADMRSVPGRSRSGARSIASDVFEAGDADRRPVVRRLFHDKLAPVERWLRSSVGRPWHVVHSEIFATFDTRTLAGRHIVVDHLLRDVDVDGSEPRARFFVDRHGLLRERAFRRRRWPHVVPLPTWAIEWIGPRKIGERGHKAYWLVPVAHASSTIVHYRQANELDPHELARWRSLLEEHRAPFRVDLEGNA